MIIFIISAIINAYMPKSISIKIIKQAIFIIEAIMVMNKIIFVLLMACIKEKKMASR